MLAWASGFDRCPRFRRPRICLYLVPPAEPLERTCTRIHLRALADIPTIERPDPRCRSKDEARPGHQLGVPSDARQLRPGMSIVAARSRNLPAQELPSWSAGLGLSESDTYGVGRSPDLPPAVTLVLHALWRGQWASLDGRCGWGGQGHEVLLDLAHGAHQLPQTTIPGPRALITSLSQEENLASAWTWILGRGE